MRHLSAGMRIPVWITLGFVLCMSGACGDDDSGSDDAGSSADVDVVDPAGDDGTPPSETIGADGGPTDGGAPSDADGGANGDADGGAQSDADAGATSDTDAGEELPVPPPEVVIYVTSLPGDDEGSGTLEDPYHDFQVAVDAAPDGATVQLTPGTYSAVPTPYADPGCGNCDDTSFYNGAEATKGFYVHGKSLHIEGGGAGLTILVTNAGYGLLFDEAGSSSVRSLSVTGGKRDADGHATDAGIVVRMTTLLVEDVSVVANNDLYTGPLPDPVVGVGGIFGREGSILTVRNSIIEDNSWDGVTLYRGLPGDLSTGPVGTVENCRIGCNPPCGNGGRGVGIAATWDADLVATGNVVHHYWKGIGSFGNTTVQIYNNVVRDQLGWGVIASGESDMVAINNLIVRNGTTGLSVWNAGVTGMFANNIVTANGTSVDEWVGVKAGIWFNAIPGTFALSNNLSWGNADVDACTGGYPNTDPCTPILFDGVDENLILDPMLTDLSANDWHLLPGSPAIDAGAEWLDDVDGTRSDMGVYGGPFALDAIDGPP